MRIVLCYPVEPVHVAQIAAACPGAEVIDAGQGRIAAELAEADIFCGHVKTPVDWQAVARRGRLRWIQSSAAGMEHCLTPPVIESEILVTSASGVLADQVSEHVLALILALKRSLPVFWEAQRRREYVRRPTADLHRSTVGIVGFGGVGRRLAEVLAPFRTRILATDLFPVAPPPHVEAIWPADRFPELARAADILVLAAPLTDATRGMIHAGSLAWLKPTALLINAARGAHVVDADLAAALHRGALAGAALDVASEEPLPASSPLWDAPRLILTPHVAGQCARRAEDITDFFCENLRRYRAGQPLRNLVDKRLGFPTPATQRV